MRVLVDTSVWSLALRRSTRRSNSIVGQFRQLIADHRVDMIGPIRQEILSGIRDEEQFQRLETHLAAFADLPLITDDYVTAARNYNLCRARGVQGSNTDFLICAAAARYDLAVFTTDNDFSRYAKYLQMRLYS